jgi:hypothetical protein
MNTNNTYLIATANNTRLLWKGVIEVDGELTWLWRNGTRLWCIPNKAIKSIEYVEFLYHVSMEVKQI